MTARAAGGAVAGRRRARPAARAREGGWTTAPRAARRRLDNDLRGRRAAGRRRAEAIRMEEDEGEEKGNFSLGWQGHFGIF
ncbi:hypothetical protein [Oryza sativa Japonica Group]|uniref:Uncharacterized protein n=1 Tax=Oryza sativa subsp. japonica TaxID=39947 RepID=Q5ZCT8_ORYSJ|nr:hypothetical protein [Oryza sativa Japonica Group]